MDFGALHTLGNACECPYIGNGIAGFSDPSGVDTSAKTASIFVLIANRSVVGQLVPGCSVEFVFCLGARFSSVLAYFCSEMCSAEGNW